MDMRLDCLARLKVDQSTGRPAPHQPCLLLAIICEIQAGHIVSPRIQIDTRLIARYHDIFETVTGDRHRARPWMPIWALRNREGPTGKLWRPEYVQAVQGVADQMGQPKSMNQLEQRFGAAQLDPALFLTLQDPAIAREACALMANRYLSSDKETHARLQAYLETALASGEYEKAPERLTGEVRESDQSQARSAAFRSLVLEAYDYCCAASRRRFITPDFRFLVEAAHLIPFAASRDDRPCNGLALTPDLHWAMDNHLIAPGPDRNWHVSPMVDSLVEDNQWLWRLDKQPLVLPRDERFHPHEDGLAWRIDHLQR
ncbi:HNH endonuclease [Halomonas sp. TRM85114]|uniref:HNH endonuclease n=1 Tax=Halomonas jincaotanensis TaxID=2810616 RepID=UPI001BD33A50|nr:HNH endonuclease [Halomonas jincaotanensis]MBS9405174.1 HNH endonuclease [Halomonas jincaotanensis]